MKENIPPDAILHVCGSSQIYLHFSADKKVFSLDDGALSDLPEYGNCEVGEFKLRKQWDAKTLGGRE